MNHKTSGIAFFVLGLALTVTFSGRLSGSVPGIVLMIVGIVFLLKPQNKNK